MSVLRALPLLCVCACVCVRVRACACVRAYAPGTSAPSPLPPLFMNTSPILRPSSLSARSLEPVRQGQPELGLKAPRALTSVRASLIRCRAGGGGAPCCLEIDSDFDAPVLRQDARDRRLHGRGGQGARACVRTRACIGALAYAVTARRIMIPCSLFFLFLFYFSPSLPLSISPLLRSLRLPSSLFSTLSSSYILPLASLRSLI